MESKGKKKEKKKRVEWKGEEQNKEKKKRKNGREGVGEYIWDRKIKVKEMGTARGVERK